MKFRSYWVKLVICLSMIIVIQFVFTYHLNAIEAGIAVQDITPPIGIKMWGFEKRQDPATGIWDPLYAKAVVFDDGKNRAAIVSIDLGRTPPDEQIVSIKKIVKQKYHINQLMLAATHTHNGPYFGVTNKAEPWLNELIQKIIEVIGKALKNKQPVNFSFGHGNVDISYDRRVVNPDGKVTMMWENYKRRATKPVDQRIRVVQINSETGKSLATLVHYACHPVIAMKSLKYSADFPAGLCSYVEKYLGGTCIYLQGACGNINPYMSGFVNADKGYGFLIKEGETVGKAVVGIAKHLKPINANDLIIKTFINHTTLELIYPFDDERIQKVVHRLYDRNWIDRLLKAKKKELIAETPIIMLGKSIAWVGFPGEFFDDFQRELYERSPVPYTFFVGFCNGYLSYFPTIKASAEGGYGANYGLLAEVGAGERLVNKSIIGLYKLLGLI